MNVTTENANNALLTDNKHSKQLCRHWKLLFIVLFVIIVAILVVVFVVVFKSSNESTTISNYYVPSVKLLNAASTTSLMPIIGLGTGGWISPKNISSPYMPTIWNESTSYNYSLKWLNLWSYFGNKEGIIRFDGANWYEYPYKSQSGVSAAIREFTEEYTKIVREKIFIVSKTGLLYAMGYNETFIEIEEILDIFDTDYVDLLLIHTPWNPRQLSYGQSTDKYCNMSNLIYYSPSKCRKSTWKAYEKLFEVGKAKAIGVSNFFVQHLNDTFYSNNGMDNDDTTLNIKHYPSVNQIEFNGYWHPHNVVQYCKDKNILVNGYSPLGAPDFVRGAWNILLTEHPIAQNIADKYNKSISQIWLRWQIQQGIVVNPRSSNIEHQEENINIFDFQLTQQEMLLLASITDLPNDIPVNPDPSELP